MAHELTSSFGQIWRHRNPQLLVDSNLLLLYFVGALRPDLIKSFGRTAAYSSEDFELLETLFSNFKSFATTPHVLAEVSNLMGQCHEPLSSELRTYLRRAIQPWNEPFMPSGKLVDAPHFPRFGLTDTAIIALARHNRVVLTDDHPLAGFLESRKVQVLRFSKLREMFL